MLSILDEKVSQWDRDSTDLFFGHEYAEPNLKFARYVCPENELIQHRYERAKENADRMEPSLPGKLSEEYEHNLFYQCHD